MVGTGSQTGSIGRWGDYSSMSVDPVRRLHLLLHAGVRRDDGWDDLANARRELHDPDVWAATGAAATTSAAATTGAAASASSSTG